MANSEILDLKILYEKLFSHYGSQGWWPLLDLKPEINPTQRGRYTGYHPNDFNYPKNENQIFEVIIGTILAQNTSWVNAERALWNLAQKKLISEERLNCLSLDDLAQFIRSSGYFNQKAIKIQNMLRFLQEYPISSLKKFEISELRSKLLAIKGVGPETADSIILYAFKKPVFVVDSYTKRLISRLGLIPIKTTYDHIQNLFHTQLEADYNVYNEYHAVIVQHCVHVCSSRPTCDSCFLNPFCRKIIQVKVKKKGKKKTRKQESKRNKRKKPSN